MKFSGPEPVLLTLQEELAMLERMDPARRADPGYRTRLAKLYLLTDRFEEVVDLLDPLLERLPNGELMMLGRALLNMERSTANKRAADVFGHAARLASDASQRSQALAELAKVMRRIGDPARARHLLDEALECDPSNVQASKRLASLELERGRPTEVLAHVEAMRRLGISHTRMLSNEMLALAALGETEAARKMLGLDWAFDAAVRDEPDGWQGPQPYHLALAEELAAHPGLSADRYGAASNRTWRVDDPLLRRSTAVASFPGFVEREFGRYLNGLPDLDHPILRNKPDGVRLRFWSVITDAHGWEAWHMHQGGWISGVYYVRVPQQVADGPGTEGCLELGISPEIVPREIAAAFGTRQLRPQMGLMAFFPSFAYHRSFAHGSSGQRICVAFDLAPA